MFDNIFNGVMGKIKNGCCRLSMNGKIAIKTTSGYKTYNEKTGSLTDCSHFVLDIADDMFFMMPTRKLNPGDIVLINGKPVYVLEIKSKNRVEVMDYEDSSIKTVIPERHALMGRKFYGKIVSLIGSGFMTSGKNSFFKNMLKMKMMSSMLGGSESGTMNAFPLMMMMGGGSMDSLFDGLTSDEDENDSCDIFNMNIDDMDEDEDEEVELKKTVKKAVKKGAK